MNQNWFIACKGINLNIEFNEPDYAQARTECFDIPKDTGYAVLKTPKT